RLSMCRPVSSNRAIPTGRFFSLRISALLRDLCAKKIDGWFSTACLRLRSGHAGAHRIPEFLERERFGQAPLLALLQKRLCLWADHIPSDENHAVGYCWV